MQTKSKVEEMYYLCKAVRYDNTAVRFIALFWPFGKVAKQRKYLVPCDCLIVTDGRCAVIDKHVRCAKSILDVHNGLPRQIVGYICNPNIVDGYTMVQINPAYVYLSQKNTGNLSCLLQQNVTTLTVTFSKVNNSITGLLIRGLTRRVQTLRPLPPWQ